MSGLRETFIARNGETGSETRGNSGCRQRQLRHCKVMGKLYEYTIEFHLKLNQQFCLEITFPCLIHFLLKMWAQWNVSCHFPVALPWLSLYRRTPLISTHAKHSTVAQEGKKLIENLCPSELIFPVSFSLPLDHLSSSDPFILIKWTRSKRKERGEGGKEGRKHDEIMANQPGRQTE